MQPEQVPTRTHDLTKIVIFKTDARVDWGSWGVWVPPHSPNHFDGDSYAGPAGDSYWRTYKEASQFANMVLANA